MKNIDPQNIFHYMWLLDLNSSTDGNGLSWKWDLSLLASIRGVFGGEIVGYGTGMNFYGHTWVEFGVDPSFGALNSSWPIYLLNYIYFVHFIAKRFSVLGGGRYCLLFFKSSFQILASALILFFNFISKKHPLKFDPPENDRTQLYENDSSPSSMVSSFFILNIAVSTMIFHLTLLITWSINKFVRHISGPILDRAYMVDLMDLTRYAYGWNTLFIFIIFQVDFNWKILIYSMLNWNFVLMCLCGSYWEYMNEIFY